MLAAVLGPVAAQAEPLIGAWGGDQAVFTLTAEGGKLTTGCSQGRLAGPVSLDSRRHFDRPGSVEVGRAGPQRAEQGPQTEPAQFSGVVEGQTLRLTVRSDAGERTYVMSAGAQPKLIRCL